MEVTSLFRGARFVCGGGTLVALEPLLIVATLVGAFVAGGVLVVVTFCLVGFTER